MVTIQDGLDYTWGGIRQNAAVTNDAEAACPWIKFYENVKLFI